MMKIILKPFGVVVVGSALVGLTLLAFRGRATPDKPGDIPISVTGTASVATAASRAAARPVANFGATDAQLLNPGFEGRYAPAIVYKGPAKISGKVASGWVDNSSWANVHVKYSPDTENPHSGNMCQRIEIAHRDADWVGPQLIQTLRLQLGKTYTGAVWLRASSPVKVFVSARRATSEDDYCGSIESTVDTKWRRVAFPVVPKKESDTVFMVRVLGSGVTVWADDADLVEDGATNPQNK